MISLSTWFAVLLATAKQMPCAPMITAVLMPIDLAARGHQRPAGIARIERRVGLDDVLDHAARDASAASGRARRSRRRSRSIRSPADCRSRWRSGRGAASWNRRAARTPGCAPHRRAAARGRCRDRCRAGATSVVRPSVSDSRISLAPLTTCALVSTSPSGEMTTPEPMPPRPAWPLLSRVSTRTTAGPTVSATVDTVSRIGVEQRASPPCGSGGADVVSTGSGSSR